ncbi:MAG: nucleotidyl transferase AbiEii/AbiGii toxin family protein [Anaerolineae bacterium]|nr:nucleotidyl transferase AbiEii/AbiGii toxin family protein [Anaerolineae bacterium]
MFLQTLPDNVQSLLKQLGTLPTVAEFYLAGGSALALHLGHRVSVDLDFFTPQDDYAQEPLIQELQRVGHLTVRQQKPGTLNAILEGTQVSFFIYPYPILGEFWDLWGVRVVSVLDLALMKLAAIGQRGRKRDFIDLYFICHSGYSLAHLLARMPEKFPRVEYPSYHLLRALAYFQDAEEDEMPRMLAPCHWAQVKRFFQAEVRRLMRGLMESNGAITS